VRTSSSASIASAIDIQTIERVGKELAIYIGPIAEVVVKRAAKHCSSAKELCAMVAQEIEVEANRIQFLRSCQN
jgi:serine/threonine-protein kinase